MRTTTELTARFDLDIAVIKGDFDDFRNFVEHDALDCDTVPFEQVEDALSIELYEQDEAEAREQDAYRNRCMCCGSEPWTDEALIFVGSRLYCTKCYGEALKNRIFTEADVKRKNEQRWKQIQKQRSRRLAALKEAMRIAPHMNWEPYKREFCPLELAA